jgi:purine-binding chemotaxis protein CheW
VDLLVVEIGRQRYALLLASVREIHRAVTIVTLPRAPPIIEGVIDVRGTVIPVLDLRARFGLPPREVEPDDHLVVAWAGERLVAIRVDQAREIAHVEASAIQRAATSSPGIEHVAGVARLMDGVVLIHDLAHFLSAAESAHLDATLSTTGEAPSPE